MHQEKFVPGNPVRPAILLESDLPLQHELQRRVRILHMAHHMTAAALRGEKKERKQSRRAVRSLKPVYGLNFRMTAGVELIEGVLAVRDFFHDLIFLIKY